MKIYVVEQYEYDDDTNLYSICNGAVEVFYEYMHVKRFIQEMHDNDKQDGFDYSYRIKEFNI